MAGPGEQVRAWRPAVPGIVEVLHARFTEHAYPMHTHDTWTLLIVDAGAIEFDLERGHHGALRPEVTLLPPHVPHDGRAATPHGFRKRVLYLDTAALTGDSTPGAVDERLIGAAVDAPSLADPRLRGWIHRLHLALAEPGDEFAAQSRLALICAELLQHLRPGPVPPTPGPRLAGQLRALLDERVVAGLPLAEAAQHLGVSPAHLVRSFTATFGIAPHAYLTGRRIDRARRLLLRGVTPAEVAAATGFADQAHLTRHFRRYLGVPPGRFAAAGRR